MEHLRAQQHATEQIRRSKRCTKQKRLYFELTVLRSSGARVKSTHRLPATAFPCASGTSKLLCTAVSTMWRFFLLLVAFGLVSALPSAHAEGPVGSITELKGHAVVKRQGQQLDAAPSMPILRSDEIVTDPGGGVTMSLLNGSRLTLGESTSIVIDESIVAADQHSKSLIHLAVGRLRAVVETIGATSPDFKIHTQNAIAAARGTDFEVDFIEGKPCPQQPSCLRYTTVGVYKGTVEVTNPTSPPGASPVNVTAGYQTNVPCETPPSSMAPWGIEELGTPGYR
jgi:FecR protein